MERKGESERGEKKKINKKWNNGKRREGKSENQKNEEGGNKWINKWINPMERRNWGWWKTGVERLKNTECIDGIKSTLKIPEAKHKQTTKASLHQTSNEHQSKPNQPRNTNNPLNLKKKKNISLKTTPKIIRKSQKEEE